MWAWQSRRGHSAAFEQWSRLHKTAGCITGLYSHSDLWYTVASMTQAKPLRNLRIWNGSTLLYLTHFCWFIHCWYASGISGNSHAQPVRCWSLSRHKRPKKPEFMSCLKASVTRHFKKKQSGFVPKPNQRNVGLVGLRCSGHKALLVG